MSVNILAHLISRFSSTFKVYNKLGKHAHLQNIYDTLTDKTWSLSETFAMR